MFFQWGMTMTSPKIEEQKTPAARVEGPWATRRYCVAWPGLPSARLVRWWMNLIGGWSVYFLVVLKWQFLSNCGVNHHPVNREINHCFVFGSVGTTSFPGEVVKYNLKQIKMNCYHTKAVFHTVYQPPVGVTVWYLQIAVIKKYTCGPYKMSQTATRMQQEKQQIWPFIHASNIWNIE